MIARRGVPLIGLLAAETVSRIGSRMSMVALPWFVLVLTGSPAKAGVMAFAEMLPYVLACALGGPLLDRVGVRRASIAADAVSAVAVAAIPMLYRSGQLGFGALLVAVAVAGLLRALGDTAKQSVFGQVVPASDMDLTRATGLHDGLSRLSGMLGAPLAGLLIAALDAPTVLLIDAATFAFGAVVVLVTVPRPTPRLSRSGADGDHGTDRESYLASLRAGWRFLRGERLVLSISVMLVLTNFFDQAYSSVLAPVWARDVVGSAAALGVLFGLTGLGAVLGNAVFVVVAPRVPRWAVFAFGFLVGGSPAHLRHRLRRRTLAGVPGDLRRRDRPGRAQPDPRRGAVRARARERAYPGARHVHGDVVGGHPARRAGRRRARGVDRFATEPGGVRDGVPWRPPCCRSWTGPGGGSTSARPRPPRKPPWPPRPADGPTAPSAGAAPVRSSRPRWAR